MLLLEGRNQITSPERALVLYSFQLRYSSSAFWKVPFFFFFFSIEDEERCIEKKKEDLLSQTKGNIYLTIGSRALVSDQESLENSCSKLTSESDFGKFAALRMSLDCLWYDIYILIACCLIN